MHILAISGSLRPSSSNSAILKAIRRLFPTEIIWNDFEISQLPFFDPHIQFGEETPPRVLEFRKFAQTADYIFIATPEYAHGIPGILKNALEWLISDTVTQKKVVLFIASSSGGEYVKEYLLETLNTMDLIASEEMTYIAQTARRDISQEGEILNPALKSSIADFLKRLSLLGA